MLTQMTQLNESDSVHPMVCREVCTMSSSCVEGALDGFFQGTGGYNAPIMMLSMFIVEGNIGWMCTKTLHVQVSCLLTSNFILPRMTKVMLNLEARRFENNYL